MSHPTRLVAIIAAACLSVGLAACSTPSSTESEATAGEWTPVVIEHALGTTTIDTKPERVATVNWANHEVPLALGIVPVGMAAATFGDDDGNGVHPWVEDALEELGAPTPTLFDETDGIDFEGVADTDPDVILAMYSGLTQEDYDQLSDIAPVVAYPDSPYGTPWRDMIEIGSTALGMADEGRALVSDIEDRIDTAVAEHPALAGKSAMFMTHIDATDLSEVSFYTAKDARTKLFEDLGMTIPDSLVAASADTDSFASSRSAEQADAFDDVDIVVTYGGQELIDALKADPLLSQLPAVRNDAIASFDSEGPLGTAPNPTPLSFSYILDDYLDLLDQAAVRSK